jgi:hypothetical protein
VVSRGVSWLVPNSLEGGRRDTLILCYRVAPKHGSDPVVQEVGQYWPRVELIDHTRVPAVAQRMSLGAESSERIRIGGAGF